MDVDKFETITKFGLVSKMIVYERIVEILDSKDATKAQKQEAIRMLGRLNIRVV